MAASPRAPKQWQLTKIETFTSYKSWRQNLIYVLSLDKNFVPFLDATWRKQTAANPRRGLTNDGTTVPEAERLTAAQKNAHLDLLLGQIANFCPVISRNSIVKHSTSLNDISVNSMVSSPPERTSLTWLAYTYSQMRDPKTCFSVLWLSLRTTSSLFTAA